jgi:hypothetical protein
VAEAAKKKATKKAPQKCVRKRKVQAPKRKAPAKPGRANGALAEHASTESASDQIERELAESALTKRRDGKTPTAQELAALRRVERDRDVKLRWEHYRSIPKAHWIEMSGRQHKILNEQVERHGMPIAGRTIDLPAVARWIHEFLAANKFKLARDDLDEAFLDGGDSPALERWRSYKADREKLALERDLREWIRRDEVHDGFSVLAGHLRRAGEMLQRQYGPDAHSILDEALVDVRRDLRQRFGAPPEEPVEVKT